MAGMYVDMKVLGSIIRSTQNPQQCTDGSSAASSLGERFIEDKEFENQVMKWSFHKISEPMAISTKCLPTILTVDGYHIPVIHIIVPNCWIDS